MRIRKPYKYVLKHFGPSYAEPLVILCDCWADIVGRISDCPVNIAGVPAFLQINSHYDQCGAANYISECVFLENYVNGNSCHISDELTGKRMAERRDFSVAKIFVNERQH